MVEITKAVELSPLSLIINTNLVNGLYYAKDFDKAIEVGRKVVDMDPEFAPVYQSLITPYVAKSMYAEALWAAETYSKLVNAAEGRLAFAYVYACTSKQDESRKLLSEVEGAYRTEHISPYGIATVHFLLKENDLAFEWLEKAVADGDRYVYGMAADSELDGVRSDPRYKVMMDRIGLAQHLRPD
jgi:tetratricopeptide (TPR) repeat protein